MKRLALYISMATLVATGVIACSGGDSGSGSGGTAQQTNESGANLSGSISIDGSSTVGPISAGVAEAFHEIHSEVKPTVAESGTGGGFKKFCNDEIDIAGASRPIKDSELEACKAKGVEYIELPVAFDGLSITVNPQNTWANDLTVAELKKIWEPNSKVDSWDDIRAGFPNEKLTLYGAGTDSGTFDYFTAAITGEEGASRTDYQASEDDNTLVTGVAGDKGGLGYFGYAYYDMSKDKLKLVGVDGVKPSLETITDGTYKPLSRPLFIYVKKTSMDLPQVKAYVEYMLSADGLAVIKQTGYVPLPESAMTIARDRFKAGTTGSVFAGAPAGMTLEEVLKREAASEEKPAEKS